MFPRFLLPAQLLLWWVIGGEVGFQECILVVVVIIVSAAKCQPLKQAVRGLAGGARAPHLLCKRCCLEMESGGKWEEVRRKDSAAQTKWGSGAGGR